MDAAAAGGSESAGGGLNVIGDATGEGGDARAVNLVGDALDGLEISDGGDGETGLDDVNAETLELAGNDQLLGGCLLYTSRCV